MDMVLLKEFLLWCLLVNYGILLVWFGTFVLAHAWLYRTHALWFRLTVEQFDALNYAGVAVFKIGIVLFNLTPFIVLCILS